MSLLFSSHLLPDVEAVCDHVMVLGRGRLLAQGPIADLKQGRRPAVRGAGEGRPRPPSPAGWPALGCAVEPKDDALARRAARRARRTALLWRAARRRRRADPRPSAACGARSKRSSSRPSTEARLMPIFDQGYQHWNGQLSGHAWRWLAVTRHGVRHAAQEAAGPKWLIALGLASRRSALAAVLVFWGLLEQQSSLLQPLLLPHPRPARGDPRRPEGVPGRGLDARLHVFFGVETFFVDAPGPDRSGPT